MLLHPINLTEETTLNKSRFPNITTLAFDIFGTVLDLDGSLVPPTDRFLAQHGSPINREAFWQDWRDRQRIEQYQDSLLMLGHSGYLETCRRAFIYCLRLHQIDFSYDEVDQFMEAYQQLQPYDDALEGLRRLSQRYELIALSNGEQAFLEHLVKNNIKIEFNAVISVQTVGVFKPHPAVYRKAAQLLGREPGEIMMVAAHSFDILGARSCGYRGAYVNRQNLPTEESSFQPDLTVKDFKELADQLLQ
jgi:2-haloacid dehalogenase